MSGDFIVESVMVVSRYTTDTVSLFGRDTGPSRRL